MSNQKTTTSSRRTRSTSSTAATVAKVPRKPAARPRVGRKSDPGPARTKPPSVAAEQEEPQPSPETTVEYIAIIARLTKALESRDEELRVRSEQAQGLQVKVVDLEGRLGEMERREGELRASMGIMEATFMDDMQKKVSEASDERQKDQATIESLTRTIENLQEPKSGDTEDSLFNPMDFNDYPLVPSGGTTEPRRGSWPELSHEAFYKQTSGGTLSSATDGHNRSIERMKQAYEQQITDLSDRLSECHAQLVASQTAAQSHSFLAPPPDHLTNYSLSMPTRGEYYAEAAPHLEGIFEVEPVVIRRASFPQQRNRTAGIASLNYSSRRDPPYP